MFATVWAACGCASEARPSDQVSSEEASDPVTFVQPLVRRDTVAAGRGAAPARVRYPDAGSASPDIASSAVSEGGTTLSVRGRKWRAMKKYIGV